ncbi:C6 finger domain protein, putative [Talaromyces stipitatus ATCC 10500]|uniref:C6 finger domain protein, putative n=1 Tax=Talaromyces stipitatus (strain ATCC 10500 / CBS 375.48 / QM 6759 / NRRL 1006) TaxID=441959 RepID=B8MKJ9_TALSN|nr:C6 finger domain protein, putative [Talaromyces stipitatus ATCC 10500]EED15354.1 C6 finger domain protein, putative [Talaromyces stipitatus ATCC 10500]
MVMDTIRIPSPSAILDSPIPPPVSKRPVSNTRNVATSPKKKSAPILIPTSGTPRPKQSKSRNGCITCKAKRLKCDETKPSCQQCHKRNVTCGGYKKDFKWRPFEETQAVPKAAPKKKASPPPDPDGNDSQPRKAARRSSASSGQLLGSKEPNFFSPISSSLPDDLSLPETPMLSDPTPLINNAHGLNFGVPSLEEFNLPTIMNTPETELSSFILSSAELDSISHSLPTDLDQAVMNIPSQPSFTSMLEEDSEDAENIIRQSEPGFQLWPVRDTPPPTTQVDVAPDLSMATILFQEPEPAPGSEESLIVRFDRLTCGILSVKDGLSENPWRNLIWPMARESSALYHAVISMAAFHSSKDNPALRVFGMEHMRRSINFMVQGMGQMQTDAALATTLSLAFAETWDQQTSTGIQHLKGARALMRQALRNRVRRHPPSEELGRIRFLYNTWLYMDVIARITSMDEADTEELGDPRFAISEDGVHDVDPLMGCATTLFPLMGHVANLVQRIRKTERNSFAIISQARELKNAIDRWVLPDNFNPPEDPQSELQDSIQTAYAYRWAILLYLHQAVPEIPSPSSSVLANNTLKLLATVPLSSRTNILHIFPLFVASCEFEDEEDREWIMQRWVAMQNRLRIGNIDRCVEVIREVWRRRDTAKAERLRQQRSCPASRKGSMVVHEDHHPSKLGKVYGSSIDNTQTLGGLYSTSPTQRRQGSIVPIVEELDFEQTVRGSHHWVGVMRDWNWEGKYTNHP